VREQRCELNAMLLLLQRWSRLQGNDDEWYGMRDVFRCSVMNWQWGNRRDYTATACSWAQLCHSVQFERQQTQDSNLG
jgi:hypothetical protein